MTIVEGDPVGAPKGMPMWRGGFFAPRTTLRQRLIPGIWLAFLVIPLSDMWGRHHLSTAHRVTVTVVVVLFTGVFLHSVAARDGVREAWSRVHARAVAGGLASGVVFLCFYDHAEWSYLFVYALMAALWHWPPSQRSLLIIVTGAVTGGVALGAGMALGNAVAPVAVVLGSGASWLGFGRLVEANAALERARDEKARVAVAEERLRFARDLHDLLGHSLSVITLKSEVAGRLLPDQAERAGGEVAEIEQVARRALKEVREAVTGYRRATLGVELAGARTALAAAHVTWQEDVPAEVDLPEPVEAVVAWAIREAVTNVIRHSRAQSVAIAVTADEVEATVTVRDDGVGGAAEVGNGLRGLRERVAAVDGVLEAGPGPSGGFGVHVVAPLRAWRTAAHPSVSALE